VTVSPFDSTIYGSLLSDDEVRACFADATQINAMLEVEAALARAEAKVGLIPVDAAERITEVARTAGIDPAALRDSTAAIGLPVPAFVAALREAVGGEAAQYVHWGATSQDILDTALALQLRPIFERFAARLDTLIGGLRDLAEQHRETVMVARTRSQQAVPTTFGLKLAGWLSPLIQHRARLGLSRDALLAVQLGGAAGTLAALGSDGLAVMEGMGRELDLRVPVMPWHAQREAVVEFAGWLAIVTGSLGKVGQDLMLLAQSEVGEVRAGDGGRSSTMPQKANPVGAEILVALARHNASLISGVHQAMIQEHERGGPGWTLEWLLLPPMAAAAGAALRHALAIFDALTVDAARMAQNLEAADGLILAEPASFALAAHMPRPEAQDLVKAACKVAIADSRHLIDVLRDTIDAPVDWDALRDPANYLGASDALIDRVIAAAKAR